jgi:arginase
MASKIRIIGVPIDLGQSRRGVDMGPSAIRYADLFNRIRQIGYDVEDVGNIEVAIRDAIQVKENPIYLNSIIDTCEHVYEQARQATEDDAIPIFLGGDHSISIGTIGGITHHNPVGVIWIDAHGDFNSPQTSPSGNIHGMSVAVLTGKGLAKLVNLGRKGPKAKQSDFVIIGVRDLDIQERLLLKESGITVFTMRDIDDQGVSSVVRQALKKLSSLPQLHISLDMDSLDPDEAPGVGTPVPGGLTYREAHLLMEILADDGRVRSADIVEINPILDRQNHTAKLAVELVTSLLGQSIL